MGCGGLDDFQKSESFQFYYFGSEGSYFFNEGWIIVVAGASWLVVSNNSFKLFEFLHHGFDSSGEYISMHWKSCVFGFWFSNVVTLAVRHVQVFKNTSGAWDLGG